MAEPGPELERAVAIAARNILDDNAAILEALQVAGMGDADFNSVLDWWLNGAIRNSRERVIPQGCPSSVLATISH
jgi:hypothetical protein